MRYTITHMKRSHSPTMDEPELPTSPRKKLKLEEPSFHANIADTGMKTPAIPEVMARIPIDDNTTRHTHEHPSLDATESSTSFNQPTTLEMLHPAQICGPPNAMLDSKVENSRDHSEALGKLLSEQATNAPEIQSAVMNGADNSDDRYSKEAACGITEFVSPDLLGFSGMLKKRYASSTCYHNQ